ncbi:MAG TPA: M81 family metallopeptidase [Candidatus Latescibacteria bacterium]|jgi:microcystin degradation protein MlrC|nr:MlrC domain protein [Gemmatimonadaceae bacterium]MDP6016923.1 M81 family metallopeptidase [Candidatus Latescibacterota bacterium]HJP31261.1 M81 family metallopeptidase [Candidatus Latescibacterota bacterium]
MRIAVAGFAHESNTFSSQPTRLEDFGITTGTEVLMRQQDSYTEIAGYIAAAGDLDMELLPILSASATPAGPVTSAAYEEITGRILDGIDALASVEGVLLALHGALVAEEFPHGDAETVRRVRDLVGPGTPIVVTHDYHANVPPALVEAADALVIYKTNPHVDQRERGIEAATILARTVCGEIRPTMALAKPELLFNIYFHNTSVAPMQPLMALAIDLERQDGILSCSIAAGYQYADVEWMAPSVVVITDADQARADSEAQRIAEAMWAERDRLITDVATPEAAVRQAMASDVHPVTLLDFGDNIGGGSAGDATFVLEQLLALGADAWVVTLWDPVAVQACFEAGIGAAIALTVGARTDDEHGTPQKITGTVRTLSDGSYEERERRHGGGRRHNQGLTAVVRTSSGDGVGLLVLTTERQSPNSIHQITSVGIAPEQQKILVAKGAVAPRAAYEPVSPRLIEVDSGGACWIARGPEHYQRACKGLYEWNR